MTGTGLEMAISLSGVIVEPVLNDPSFTRPIYALPDVEIFAPPKLTSIYADHMNPSLPIDKMLPPYVLMYEAPPVVSAERVKAYNAYEAVLKLFTNKPEYKVVLLDM